jgi:hypothetical protein
MIESIATIVLLIGIGFVLAIAILAIMIYVSLDNE